MVGIYVGRAAHSSSRERGKYFFGVVSMNVSTYLRSVCMRVGVVVVVVVGVGEE